MAILLDTPIDLSRIADLCAVGMKRPPVGKRDKSHWHVTSLWHASRRIAKGDISYTDDQPVPDFIRSVGHLGRIWESAVDCYLDDYMRNLGGFYLPDVEHLEDDIVASLDGFAWVPDLEWMVCETKLRFSLTDVIPLDHLQQVRCYCHVADTDLVCYVSGHVISNPPTAKARMRIFRLEKKTIEEAWQGIVNTKNYLLSSGITPDGKEIEIDG